MKRQWKAKDLMKKNVVTVAPRIHLKELAQIFDERGISGAPVVGANGVLLGVVSKSDLVRYQHAEEFVPDDNAFYTDGSSDPFPRGFHVQVPDRTRVEEIMTPTIIRADEEAPAAALAKMMRRRKIHRIFITKEERLCGVVTTMDLLKVIAGS